MLAILYGCGLRCFELRLRNFGNNPRFLSAHTGMIAILYTWGQNLSLRPHLHCIVPGGGVSAYERWKPARSKGKYLFPEKALSKVFRARFTEGLRKPLMLPAGVYDGLFAKDWVGYCKSPFFGPSQVVEYLGRYTHKIAISNHRLKSLEEDHVVFSAKDYSRGGKKSSASVSDAEFIRRFA